MKLYLKKECKKKLQEVWFIISFSLFWFLAGSRTFGE